MFRLLLKVLAKLLICGEDCQALSAFGYRYIVLVRRCLRDVVVGISVHPVIADSFVLDCVLAKSPELFILILDHLMNDWLMASIVIVVA